MDCMQKRFVTAVRSNSDINKKAKELPREFSDISQELKSRNRQKIENRTWKSITEVEGNVEKEVF